MHEIRLAIPASSSSAVTEIVAGYIDLATLKLNEKYTFALNLPAGYRSLDEVTQVMVEVSGKNLEERVMNVSEIKVINDADGTIQVMTKTINNVTVLGDKAAVEALSEGGVIAQLDAAKLTAAQGQQNVEVDFIIPSTDKVYVKGVHTVTIKK